MFEYDFGPARRPFDNYHPPALNKIIARPYRQYFLARKEKQLREEVKGRLLQDDAFEDLVNGVQAGFEVNLSCQGLGVLLDNVRGRDRLNFVTDAAGRGIDEAATGTLPSGTQWGIKCRFGDEAEHEFVAIIYFKPGQET